MTDLATIRAAAEAPAATPLVARLQAMLLELLASDGEAVSKDSLRTEIDPETVSRACDRFHGATFYCFAKMLAGHEQQFRIGIEEAIRASRETQP